MNVTSATRFSRHEIETAAVSSNWPHSVCNTDPSIQIFRWRRGLYTLHKRHEDWTVIFACMFMWVRFHLDIKFLSSESTCPSFKLSATFNHVNSPIHSLPKSSCHRSVPRSDIHYYVVCIHYLINSRHFSGTLSLFCPLLLNNDISNLRNTAIDHLPAGLCSCLERCRNFRVSVVHVHTPFHSPELIVLISVKTSQVTTWMLGYLRGSSWAQSISTLLPRRWQFSVFPVCDHALYSRRYVTQCEYCCVVFLRTPVLFAAAALVRMTYV